MWLILALINAVTFATGQVFLKRGYRDFSPKATYFLNGISCVLFWLPYSWLRGGPIFSYGFKTVILFLIQPLSYIFYILALTKGKVSLISTLSAAAPIFTLIFGLLFLKELPSFFQISMLFLVIFGVILVGFSKEGLRDLKKSKSESWVFWGLASAIAFGINSVVSKKLIISTNTATFFFNIGILNMAYGLIWGFKKRSNWERYFEMSRRQFLPTAVGTILITSGAIAFFEALNLGYASLVAAVSNVATPLTVLLAWLFLKERLTRWQIIGILIVGAGVILLG